MQTVLVILSKCFRIKQLLMNWVSFQYLTSPWRSLNSPICNYRLKLCIFFLEHAIVKMKWHEVFLCKKIGDGSTFVFCVV